MYVPEEKRVESVDQLEERVALSTGSHLGAWSTQVNRKRDEIA